MTPAARPTPTHRWTRLGAAAAALAIVISACSAGPGQAAARPADAERAAQDGDVSLAGIEPPPSLAEQALAPLRGEAKERATMPRDAAIDRLAVPEYLKAADDTPDQQPDRRAPEPPAEAVKLYARGRDAVARGDWREALTALRQAVELDQAAVRPRTLLADIYVNLGQKTLARRTCEQAVKADPDDPAALFFTGWLAFDRDAYDEAAVVLDRAANLERDRLDPGLAYLTDYYLGEALWRLGYTTAAAEPLKRYLQTPRRSTRYHRHVELVAGREQAVARQLGDLALRLARPAEALKWYTRVEDDGSDMLARRVYARVMRGQHAAAVDAVMAHLTRRGSADAGVRSLAAWLASHLDDPAAFARRVRQAYEQSDRSAGLAILYARLADQTDAVTLLAEHLRHRRDRPVIHAFVQLAEPPRRAALLLELIKAEPMRAGDLMNVALQAIDDPAAWREALAGQAPDETERSAAWHFLLGRLHAADGRFKDADAEYQRALDTHFDFTPAHEAIVGLLLARAAAEPREADRLYQKVVERVDAMGHRATENMRLLQVRALAGLGQPRRALARLQPIMDDAPARPELMRLRADLLRADGQYREAELELLELLDRDPRDEAAYAALFEIYRNDNRDDMKFARLVRKAGQALPSSRVVRTRQAELAMMLDRLDEAEALLDELVRGDPTDREPLAALVALYFRTDRAAEAQARLIDLLDRDPANTAAINLLRRVAAANGDLTIFFQRFERYLQAQPDSLSVLEQRAWLYDRWSKPEKAADVLEQLLERESPRKLDHVIQLAMAYQQLGQTDRGLARLEEAGEDMPGSTLELTIARAWLLHEADRSRQALATLDQAIADAGEDAWKLRLELSRMLIAVDQPDRALAEVDRAAAAMPMLAAEIYYMQSSYAYTRENGKPFAEKLLLKALDAEADHVPSNNDLGYYWADEGRNLRRAERMIRKALAAEPTNAAYLDSMGWVLYKQGRFDAALRYLNQARAAGAANDPVVIDHLADAHWRAGNPEIAIELWRAARGQLEKLGEDLRPDQATLGEAIEAKLRAAADDQPPPVADVPGPEAVEPPSPGMQ